MRRYKKPQMKYGRSYLVRWQIFTSSTRKSCDFGFICFLSRVIVRYTYVQYSISELFGYELLGPFSKITQTPAWTTEMIETAERLHNAICRRIKAIETRAIAVQNYIM